MLPSLWATVDPHRSPHQRSTADQLGEFPARFWSAGADWQQPGLSRSLYWEFDSGGPATRLERRTQYPEFAFPQQINPDLAPPGWRPIFVDYLYLGFTNSTAFSPTDVMPLVPWAKSAMAVQSTVSLVVIGLVVARAVNIFT